MNQEMIGFPVPPTRLLGRNASGGNGPSGDCGPAEGKEKLSDRPETCHGEHTEARDHLVLSVSFPAALAECHMEHGVTPNFAARGPRQTCRRCAAVWHGPCINVKARMTLGDRRPGRLPPADRSL